MDIWGVKVNKDRSNAKLSVVDIKGKVSSMYIHNASRRHNHHLICRCHNVIKTIVHLINELSRDGYRLILIYYYATRLNTNSVQRVVYFDSCFIGLLNVCSKSISNYLTTLTNEIRERN